MTEYLLDEGVHLLGRDPSSARAESEEDLIPFHQWVFLSQSVLKLCKPQSIASPDWAA